MTLKETWKKIKKPFLISALGLSIITGTYTGNEGGCAPIHTRKTGNSYGLNLGLNTEFMPGSKLYGINISPYNKVHEEATINGINLNIWGNDEGGKLNGLELSIMSFPSDGNSANAKIINGSLIWFYKHSKKWI